MSRRVAIISYGTGNLASLRDALEAVGAECYVANTASDQSRFTSPRFVKDGDKYLIEILNATLA